MRNNLKIVETKLSVAHQILVGNPCIISTFINPVLLSTTMINEYVQDIYDTLNIILFHQCSYSSLFLVHVACDTLNMFLLL